MAKLYVYIYIYITNILYIYIYIYYEYIIYCYIRLAYIAYSQLREEKLHIHTTEGYWRRRLEMFKRYHAGYITLLPYTHSIQISYTALHYTITYSIAVQLCRQCLLGRYCSLFNGIYIYTIYILLEQYN